MRDTILILQGRGALGAFECGVVRALEEKGIHPDVVAGVSMGAINAAIIASHPAGKSAEALDAFWSEIGMATPLLPHEGMRRMAASYQTLMMGVPKCFTPKWFTPHWGACLPASWTSFYDGRPLKKLLEKHVDFKGLASGKTRLLLSAVNVETGEPEVFDNQETTLSPEHIVASGSLPPEFPWTPIDGRVYWDGALASGSPLRPLLDRMIRESIRGRAEVREKKVYIVNPPPGVKQRPRNLLEVLERQKGILSSDKIQSDLRETQRMNDALLLISTLLSKLDEKEAKQVRESQVYKRFVSQSCWVEVVRIDHAGEPGEGYLRDYDFSKQSIRKRQALGLQKTNEVLAKEGTHAFQ